MERYYVKRGDSDNNCFLRHAPSGVNPGDGWEPISRREAEQLARLERRRRHNETPSSSYADAEIWPYDVSTDDRLTIYDHRFYSDGVIMWWAKEDHTSV